MTRFFLPLLLALAAPTLASAGMSSSGLVLEDCEGSVRECGLASSPLGVVLIADRGLADSPIGTLPIRLHDAVIVTDAATLAPVVLEGLASIPLGMATGDGSADDVDPLAVLANGVEVYNAVDLLRAEVPVGTAQILLVDDGDLVGWVGMVDGAPALVALFPEALRSIIVEWPDAPE